MCPRTPTAVLLLTLAALGLPASAQVPGGAITGAEGEGFFGERMAAGDLNGDGATDLLVRSSLDDRHRLRLFLGGGLATSDLRAEDADLVLAEYPVAPASTSQTDFVVGDFDGDGFDDVLVRARLFCGAEALGAEGVLALDASVPTDLLAAGDLNGDGIDDLVVGGAVGAGDGPIPGSVQHVFLGGARFAALCDGTGGALTPEADAALSIHIEGEAAAARALATGDLNGDGFDDLLVADASERPSVLGPARGAAFAFFGAAALPPTRAVTAEQNDADASFYGVGDDGGAWPDGARVAFRSSVAAGDLDGDGFDDVVVAAQWRDGFDVSVRREVLVFRGGATLAGAFAPASAEGRVAFAGELWVPPPGEEVLVGAGDLTGDGFDDLLIAAAPIDEYRASWARFGPLSFPFEATQASGFDFFSSGTTMFAVLSPPLPLGDVTGGGCHGFAVAEPNATTDADPFEHRGRVALYRCEGGGEVLAGEGPAAVPAAMALEAAYPNPARAGEGVRFTLRLSQPAVVRLAVFDALGRQVAVLVSGDVGAGTHEVAWAGTDGSGRPLAAGLYFYRAEAGSQAETRRLTLVR